jgi:hypothetical protein
MIYRINKIFLIIQILLILSFYYVNYFKIKTGTVASGRVSPRMPGTKIVLRR